MIHPCLWNNSFADWHPSLEVISIDDQALGSRPPSLLSDLAPRLKSFDALNLWLEGILSPEMMSRLAALTARITSQALLLFHNLGSVSYLSTRMSPGNIPELFDNIPNVTGARLMIDQSNVRKMAKFSPIDLCQRDYSLEHILDEISEKLTSVKYFCIEGPGLFWVLGHGFVDECASLVGFAEKTTVEYIRVYDTTTATEGMVWPWYRIIRDGQKKYMEHKRMQNYRLVSYDGIEVGFHDSTLLILKRLGPNSYSRLSPEDISRFESCQNIIYLVVYLSPVPRNMIYIKTCPTFPSPVRSAIANGILVTQKLGD
ncbi:hypothetical protein M422DRAFT_46413 [Sphaerobolus stellatus SS14]|uniref:Uncharacterized protein n=1 Tax=Sphaerobolus stellatus (strain SS14) TaxID=990650 RepID=A0A0C9USH2_SPHS4|nr:hypothetical protein M422DRAFT_46413 [Sphaerobolus stellatus SS14]